MAHPNYFLCANDEVVAPLWMVATSVVDVQEVAVPIDHTHKQSGIVLLDTELLVWREERRGEGREGGGRAEERRREGGEEGRWEEGREGGGRSGCMEGKIITEKGRGRYNHYTERKGGN